MNEFELIRRQVFVISGVIRRGEGIEGPPMGLDHPRKFFRA